jgi:hypothetical protein
MNRIWLIDSFEQPPRCIAIVVRTPSLPISLSLSLSLSHMWRKWQSGVPWTAHRGVV